MSAVTNSPATREDLLRALAADLARRDPGHPLRVGIDGVCGAGKTTFARDLVAALEAAPGGVRRRVVHLDSDGFHHVRERRYRAGRTSARGYYDDAYDLDALRDRVLRPLGDGGDRRIATKVHDLDTDAVVTDAWAEVAEDAIVVFEATFLQRGELRREWDVVVFLDASREVALARGVRRDAARLGGEPAAREAYERRYLGACDLYLAEESPRERADLVIRNDDPQRPVLLRGLS